MRVGLTFPPRAVFKDKVLGAELDPQHDPDTLTTGLQANESRQGEGWPEKSLSAPTTPRADRFFLPEPPTRTQMLTSCQNKSFCAQTGPIIIPPSLEGGGAPRDPPSLTGWFWRAELLVALPLAQRAASPSIGPGVW